MKRLALSRLMWLGLVVVLGELVFDAAAQTGPGSDVTWRAGGQLQPLRHVNGDLITQSLGNDPQLLSQPLSIDASRIKAVTIKLAADGGEFAQLFWPDWSERRSIRFPIIADGRPHRYLLPLAEHPDWRGQIRQLRFDPTDAPMTSIRLHAFELHREPVRPSVAVGGQMADVIFAAAGASAPLQLTAVTTGTMQPRRIKPPITATGPVRVSDRSDRSQQWIYEGSGPATLTVGNRKMRLVPVQPRQVDPVDLRRAATVTVARFTGGLNSSQWSAPEAAGQAVDVDGASFVRFPVKHSLRLALGRQVNALDALVFEGYARGEVTLCIEWADAAGSLHKAVAWPAGNEPGLWRVDVPVGHRGAGTIRALHAYGNGALLIRSLIAIGTADQVVHISARDLARLELPGRGHWIMSHNQPIHLALNPPSNQPRAVRIRRLFTGEAHEPTSIELTDHATWQMKRTGVYDITLADQPDAPARDLRVYVITPGQMPWPLDPLSPRPTDALLEEDYACPH